MVGVRRVLVGLLSLALLLCNAVIGSLASASASASAATDDDDTAGDRRSDDRPSFRVAFWTGYASQWGASDLTSGKSVYGSELALLNVAEHLAAVASSVNVDVNLNVDVYVTQDAGCYMLRGVRWCHQDTLEENAANGAGHKYDVMVVSRYVFYFLEQDAQTIADRTYVWVHDIHPQNSWNFKILPESGIPFIRNIDAIVDGWVAVSQTHKRLLVDKYQMDFQKVAVIPNAISDHDVELTSLETTTTERTRITNSFVFASDPERDLDTVLRMFPQITEVLPNATLSIYYKHSEDAKLLQMAVKQPNVHWVGRVSHEELMQQWARTDYWLYPTTFFETCCTTTMESALAGALHITSTTGAVAENCQGVALPGDPGTPAFMQKVLDILQFLDAHPDEKERQRQTQREWALRQHWGQRAQMWLQLMQSQAYTKDISSSRPAKYAEPEGRWTGAALLQETHGDAQNPFPIDTTNPGNWHWYVPPLAEDDTVSRGQPGEEL
ncbi:MAG: hypothetical protein SGILL_004339 [Bacillariaceae sp.]